MRQDVRVARDATGWYAIGMSIAAEELNLTSDEAVGINVILWLRRRGKQQMELANWLGLNKASVSRKTLGKTPWSVQDLVSTAAFLDVPISALLPDSVVEEEQKKKARTSEDAQAVQSHLRESNSRPIHYE
ncbi:helix-turn-helix domain-containing protein [Actinotignum sp. GS-2025g]|uniref:helix-turn-helix domain-containing protein n=1 Tax=Actinotignum sp. GS-2025g TaxID=3427280 RepID=UPI003F475B43